MQRHATSSVGSILFKASLLLLLAAAALNGPSDAVAQDGTTGADETSQLDAEAPVPDPPAHLPFTSWDDSDAIPFDSLPAAEQGAVMEQAQRSETNAGYEVAQQWSAYSREMAATAAAESARRIAGLTGTDDIGVAP